MLDVHDYTKRACHPECCNHGQDGKQNSQLLPTTENSAPCGRPSPNKHKHGRRSSIHEHDHDDYDDYDDDYDDSHDDYD